jgi:hypothetical protein
MKELIDRLRVHPVFGLRPPVHGKLRNEAADALERLTAENAALRKDAERYRWLRDRAWPFEFNGNTPEDADAAIDKSMHLAARLAAAKKHTPECSYWDGLMAQVCNCGLAERDHNDD